MEVALCLLEQTKLSASGTFSTLRLDEKMLVVSESFPWEAQLYVSRNDKAVPGTEELNVLLL